eukprot:TRINITY_DN23986_c0_g1_i2.p1 TRINITY_DN23986_c0_g1~~TRINITY_DN23986_c0_g1_i2.p1  ORF type:complete len:331 (+),score=62.52 TRINITY_DN23986_c0_g1_i2:96-1088(+)
MLRSLVGSEMCIRDSLYSAIPCVHSAAADGPISLGYQLKFVDTTKHPLAVCNDGTPAAYYLHTSARSRDWVLHQQGGWWCWDDYSCAVRWAHFQNHTTEKRTLMSTGQLAALTAKYDTFNGEKNTGIMAHNSTGNPMSAASKVFVVYCSSDSHAGNRSAGYVEGAGDSKWHFRGKEIVKAVLGELNANHGLGTASSVVLTGGSAGGMATLNNADYVGEMLKEMAPGVNFVAMPDSGFFVDVMPGRSGSSVRGDAFSGSMEADLWRAKLCGCRTKSTSGRDSGMGSSTTPKTREPTGMLAGSGPNHVGSWVGRQAARRICSCSAQTAITMV